MIIAGGRPSAFREVFMVKDSEGFVVASQSYVKANPQLFRYVGHFRINSTLYHTYEFIG